MLFWNLWNISYPYDVLTEYKNDYQQEYILFNEMHLFCWSILNEVDKKMMHLNLFLSKATLLS